MTGLMTRLNPVERIIHTMRSKPKAEIVQALEKAFNHSFSVSQIPGYMASIRAKQGLARGPGDNQKRRT